VFLRTRRAFRSFITGVWVVSVIQRCCLDLDFCLYTDFVHLSLLYLLSSVKFIIVVCIQSVIYDSC
jgi:hypothetical protein